MKTRNRFALILALLITSAAPAQPATRPVLPIGVWQQPPTTFATWRARGVNVIITDAPKPDGAERQQYMIKAADAGLRVWIGTFPQVADEPAFAGYVQPDEPEKWGSVIKRPDGSFDWPATTAAHVQRYAALKAATPSVLVFSNFAGGPLNSARQSGGNPQNPLLADYREFIKGGDVLCSDFYLAPQGRDTVLYPEFAAGTTGRLVTLSDGKKPVWAYVDTCDYGEPHTNARQPRHPTPDEIRAHAYVNIIHGATGIVYFPLKVRGGFRWDNVTPENAAAITSLNADLQQNAVYFLSGSRALRSLTAATWKLDDGSTLTVDAKHAGGKWSVEVVETSVATLKARVEKLEGQIEKAREALKQ